MWKNCEKLVNFWKWLKADKETWKKRILIILGISVVFAAGTKITQTTIIQTSAKYYLNPIAQTQYTLGNNQFISKTSGYTITIGKAGETYFLPEYRIDYGDRMLSLTPKSVYNIENANFNIYDNGKIKYSDDDNGIDYIFYFNQFNNCQTDNTGLNSQCNDAYEQEIVFNRYTTSTIYFNATSTFSIDGNNQFTFTRTEIDLIPQRTETITPFTILPIVVKDNNNNTTVGTLTFYNGIFPDIGLKAKIEIDNGWMMSASYPVIVDPTYQISNYLFYNLGYASNAGRKLAIDNYGTLHTVFSIMNGAYNHQIVYASSTDNGVSWSTSSVYYNASIDANRSSLAIDSANNVYVVYIRINSGRYTVFLKKFNYLTRTWGSEVQISNNTYEASHPNVLVDNNDNVYVFYPIKNTTKYQIAYKKYTKATDSWGSETFLTTETYDQLYGNSAIDSQGNIHLVWAGYTTTYSTKLNIRYMKYTASTNSWSSITNITNINYSQGIPNIVVDKYDNPYVLWGGISSDSSGYYRLRFARYDNGYWTTINLTSDNYDQNDGTMLLNNDYIYLTWNGKHSDSTSYYQVRYMSYNLKDRTFSSITNLTSASGNSYCPSFPFAIYPVRTTNPKSGFALVYNDDYNDKNYIYLSDDFDKSEPRGLVKSYDFNSNATGTYYLAYRGILSSTSSIGYDINSWPWRGATPVQFSADLYSKIQSDNYLYASTSPTQSPFSYPYYYSYIDFVRSAQKYQFCISDNPSQFRDFTWEWRGYLNVWATSSVTTTAAQTVKLYAYDYDASTYRLLDSRNSASCITEKCMLRYTTSTVSKFFQASSTISRWCTDYVVAGVEANSDCRTDADSNLISCAKFLYDTVDGETKAIGCQTQTTAEDLNNECTSIPNDIPTGCYTGNCGGLSTSYFPFGCNWYWDNAQHNCPQCYGCPNSYNPANKTCEAKTVYPGYGDPDYGCTGACYACTSGSCSYTPCIGEQCGCSFGQICDATGNCVSETPPDCNTICIGLGYTNGGCMNTPQCSMRGGYIDGNSTDCTTPRACCCF